MKKTKLPSLVTILILTLITSLFWVSFNVYRAFSLKPSPAVPDEISNPLTPTLDTDSLAKIQSRIFFNDSQIPEITVSGTTLPVATVAPAKTASPSAIPSPTPATGSAVTPTP